MADTGGVALGARRLGLSKSIVSRRLGLLPDSSLIARRICSFRGRLVASPAYLAERGQPRNLEDLPHHSAVIKKGEVWPLLDGHKTVTVRPHGRFFADNGEAILAATLVGAGVAALPDFLIEPHIAAGTLVPVLPANPAPELGMFVVRPPGALAPRKVRILVDILLEHFGDQGAGCGRSA